MTLPREAMRWHDAVQTRRTTAVEPWYVGQRAPAHQQAKKQPDSSTPQADYRTIDAFVFCLFMFIVIAIGLQL